MPQRAARAQGWPGYRSGRPPTQLLRPSRKASRPPAGQRAATAADNGSAATASSSLLSRSKGAGARPFYGLASLFQSFFDAPGARPRLILPCPTDVARARVAEQVVLRLELCCRRAPCTPRAPTQQRNSHCTLSASADWTSVRAVRRQSGRRDLIFCAGAWYFRGGAYNGDAKVSAESPAATPQPPTFRTATSLTDAC